jgi:thymidylate synthase (FAD)
LCTAPGVSNPGNQDNMDTADRLIAYLIRKKHWSPFEMVNVVVEIETTRDIGRQILRHQAKFQEFSQRYSSEIEFCEPREARIQDTKNRQNSLETDDKVIKGTWEVIQRKCIEQTGIDYKWAIDHGIAKEQARVILPEGLTMSRMYVNNYLRNWIHYLQQRLDVATQKEHRLIAQLVRDELIKEFPGLTSVLDTGTPTVEV